MSSDKFMELVPDLRVAGTDALSLLRKHDFDLSEEAAIAYLLWETELQECLDDRDFELGWYCCKAAVLGPKVFEGPRRLCPAQLNGLPVGIVCDPIGARNLLQELWHAMYTAGEFEHTADLPGLYASWKVPATDGSVVELMSPGQRVAHIMERQRTILFCIASLQATKIAEWADSHRLHSIAA